MESGTRRRSQTRLVFSEVHESSNCTLCKETYVQYTHPIKWKNQELLTFLKSTEPDLTIHPDSCICRNCSDSLQKVQKDPQNFCPRWRKERSIHTKCEVASCSEPVSKSTQLASREEVSRYLECSLNERSSDSNSMITHLCDKHYRSLQKKLNPENYQWKCVVCSTGIRGSNYSNFRACSEPELFQKHLVDHTDFQGTITVSDKLCAACYRHSLTISKIQDKTRDTDGHLDIYWDTEENRYKVKSRVDLLMKGCGCKSGCVTNTDVDAGRMVKLVVLAADVSTVKTLTKVNKQKE